MAPSAGVVFVGGFGLSFELLVVVETTLVALERMIIY